METSHDWRTFLLLRPCVFIPQHTQSKSDGADLLSNAFQCSVNKAFIENHGVRGHLCKHLSHQQYCDWLISPVVWPPCASVWSAGNPPEQTHRPSGWRFPWSRCNGDIIRRGRERDHESKRLQACQILTWWSSSWRADSQWWSSRTLRLHRRYELHTSVKADRHCTHIITVTWPLNHWTRVKTNHELMNHHLISISYETSTIVTSLK